MLSPSDIIEGTLVKPHHGLYVLGSYDSRITFYSEQVRGLELAHALSHQHLLPANARVGVVGGGAAGLAVAAGLALQGGCQVHLYERAHRLLPLQGDSDRRRLDPYIYDWPYPDTEHERAELPILDWKSASAKDVREAVLWEFSEVQAATAGRLAVNLSHQVTKVSPQDGRYLLAFEREAADGGREAGSAEFDLIVLAFGFGLENRQAIPGTETQSYWRDAGVPGAEIDGNPRPTFLVSGNGDGGLIDLIASASSNFRHDDIVRGIAHRQGVQALRESLLAVDAEAMAADAKGQGFDFLAAYEAAVGPQVEQLGLVDQVKGQLRGGVQLYFQTREPEMLSVRAARLNRFAVYLLSKAFGKPGPEQFRHIVCDEVTQIAPEPLDREDARRMVCGPTIVVADYVIARRGPGRQAVRQPFADLLVGYEAVHEAWVRKFLPDSIAPKLGPATRQHFKQLAVQAHLPPARYNLPAMVAAMPRSGKLWMAGGSARWSGEVPPNDVSSLWSDESPPMQFTVIGPPDQFGASLAHAVARLAIHAPRMELLLDVARWRPFITVLSSSSPSAPGLPFPRLGALAGNPSILNLEVQGPDVLAAGINRALDLWLLEAVRRHLERYFQIGDDPGHVVSFVAAEDLRVRMSTIWEDWVLRFQADPDLLARFIGLAVCAKDDAAHVSEASVLAGRLLLTPLIRACAVALAVATSWEVTAPRNAKPGNLGRMKEGTERTGHACSAGLIDSEEMALIALRHAWTTEFVLLPMQSVPAAIITGANALLSKTAGGAPLIGQPGVSGKLVLTVDQRFRSAARAGANDLAALLLGAEHDHFERLKAAVQLVGGEDD